MVKSLQTVLAKTIANLAEGDWMNCVPCWRPLVWCPALCYQPRCLTELEPKTAQEPSSSEWKHRRLVINGCPCRHYARLFSNSPCCYKVVIALFFCGLSERLLLVFNTPSSLTAAASFLSYLKVADCLFNKVKLKKRCVLA